MKNKKEVFIGLAILIVLILGIIGYKIFQDSSEVNLSNLKQVTVAVRWRKRRLFSR